MASNWAPPQEWFRLTAVDAHTGGEPLRVFTSGWPALPGGTMLAKRRFAQEHYDHLRRATIVWARHYRPGKSGTRYRSD
jgi:trans-L-3-hydroxyproline dehydratase